MYTDGKGPAPARYAHAVIHVGTVKVPYVQDIRVGPLPVAVGTTRIEPLNYPYNKGVGRTRNSLVKIFENADWLNQVGANLSDITMDLWGKSMTGLANDTLSLVDNTSPVEEDGRLVSWVQFHTVPTFDFDSSTLLPLGLYG